MFFNQFKDAVLFTQFYKNTILAVSLCLILNLAASPQENPVSSYWPDPEKIYIQLDGKVYTTDQTIWFKSIVTNACDLHLTKLSGVLYVELIGPDEKIIEKKLIKLDNGIGTGFFDLNQTYQEGTYLVRAYTEWDQNFGLNFFFKEYIQLFTPSSKASPDPISNIRLTEKDNNERRLTIYFDPLAIDSLHKKDLSVYIMLDNRKDSLSIKRNSDNNYLLDYSIPDGSQFVSLKIQTSNLSTYSKTIALDEDRMDLQFFPESGEMVEGLPCKVAFKALDYKGTGTRVEGDIVNDKGDIITTFKSNQLGMGSFVLFNVDTNIVYSASIKSKSDEKLSLIYHLPKVTPVGSVLSVRKNRKWIFITASSNYLKNDSIYIRVSGRGILYYDIKGQTKEGVLRFSLPADSLPEGIIAFTLMNKFLEPLGERLYFNERPENNIKITIVTDKDTCSQRGLTNVKITTSNETGMLKNVNLSLLVFNKKQMGSIQDKRLNILSYLLLNSDLKGEIENPGYYFRNDSVSFYDIDVLLLTQGWSKYIYSKPLEKVSLLPETNLTVSGTVGGIFFQKKKSAELTLMTFGRQRKVQTQTTNESGRFSFNINDEYGEKVNVLIQTSNKTGKNRNYTVLLDKKESPSISFNHILAVGKVDSVIHRLVEKNIERKKIDEKYLLSSGDIRLPEVVVEAYKITPARKKVMEVAGKPSKVISGEEIQKKEEKWSFGLYSVIQSKYPDILIHRYLGYHEAGYLWAQVRKSMPTLVVIDGITVGKESYALIPNIPPSEVSSFEIIKNARYFATIYQEFDPYADPRAIPGQGDVIAIYTYAGAGIFGAIKPEGILKAAVPAFSAKREFYAPKYEHLQPTDWYKPDLRALIYWNPVITADSTGNATASFYNADNTGEMEIVVEAISDQGEIGYKETTYIVKKRD